MSATLAEQWEALRYALRMAGVALVHSVGLHTRSDVERLESQVRSARAAAEYARAGQRETQRLLVLLSEPLKDWDLADFPAWAERPLTGQDRDISTAHQRHLSNVVAAYRLTATAVAPLRMGRKVDDKVKGQGWGDLPLARGGVGLREAGENLKANMTPRRNLP